MLKSIKSLIRDIKRLKDLLNSIEDELVKMDESGAKDLSRYTKLIKDKVETKKLLNDVRKELEIEKSNQKTTVLGKFKVTAPEIAKLSIGGSLRTSSLDKTSLTDKAKEKIVDDILGNKAYSDAEKAKKLLQKGLIVQRKIVIN